jgi:uncharacterized protein YjbI with pentapeptide repeats
MVQAGGGRESRFKLGRALAVLVASLVIAGGGSWVPALAAPPIVSGHTIGSDVAFHMIQRGVPLGYRTTIKGDLNLNSLDSIDKPFRCVNCTIKGSLTAQDVEFKRIVNLGGLRVTGQLDLFAATFDDDVLLRTSYRGPAVISKTATFGLATFKQRAVFDGTQFGGDSTDFSGAKFLGEASFRGTSFSGPVKFSLDDFEQGVSFGVIPSLTAGSTSAQTPTPSPAPTPTPTPTIQCEPPPICRSSVIGVFVGDVDFTGTLFRGDANFLLRRFDGNANFAGARFGGDTEFTEAQFVHEAHFGGTHFAGATSFRGVTFAGRAFFSYATAASSLEFRQAKFPKGVTFQLLAVDGELSLRGASTAPLPGQHGKGCRGEPINMSRLRTTDLDMDVSLVNCVAESQPAGEKLTVREQILQLVEASAGRRGEIGLANDAHYRLLSLENQNHNGQPLRFLNWLLYGEVAGYFVRAVHPATALLALLLVFVLIRIAYRRRVRGVWRDTVASMREAIRGKKASTTASLPRPRSKTAPAPPLPSKWSTGLTRLEVWTFRIVFVLLLIAVAKSNSTLRQLLDSLTG